MEALPQYLESVARAFELGANVLPEAERVAQRFGFDSLTCWIATHDRPQVEGRIYELTTLPFSWALYYDDNAFVEIDPRVRAALDQAVPVIWDRSTWRHSVRGIEVFLDAATRFGIGSGLCIPLHDPAFGFMRVDLESHLNAVEGKRHSMIATALGELTLVARFLHDEVVDSIGAGRLQPRGADMALSHREAECLTIAAQGLPSDQIARKLGVPAQIINLHLDAIRGKLGALNIDEAVALAIRDRLIMI